MTASQCVNTGWEISWVFWNARTRLKPVRAFICSKSVWKILDGEECGGKLPSELSVSLELMVKSFPDVPQNNINFHSSWGSMVLSAIMVHKGKHSTVAVNCYSCLKGYNLPVLNILLETSFIFKGIKKFKRLGCSPFANKRKNIYLMFAEHVMFLCSSSGIRDDLKSLR